MNMRNNIYTMLILFLGALLFWHFRSMDREQRAFDREMEWKRVQFENEQRALDRQFDSEQRELDRQLQRKLAGIKNCSKVEADCSQDKPAPENESPQN